MTEPDKRNAAPVALWRINAMRLLFLLMALVMGTMVWSQLIFDSNQWPLWKGVGKSLLAALALISLIGVRYPLQMLPLMLFEIAWKTIWLVGVALPAWLGGRWSADLNGMFNDCIGIVIAYFIVPWGYAWHRYIVHPMEPLRRS